MLDPQSTRGLEARAVEIYGRAELYLIRVIRDAIIKAGEAPTWAEAQLLAIRQERGRIQGMAAALEKQSINLWLETIDAAYASGVIAAETELASIPESAKGFFNAAPGSTVVNDVAVLALASESVGAMSQLHQNILRATDDIWRRITAEAAGYTVSGVMTPQQAAQRAFTRMSRDGLGFFTDKAGRKWGLDTYAEMAVRTATNRALRAGHSDTMVEHGVDLVVVSSHPNPAPQCAPYERKVLSLTGRFSAGTHRIGDSIVGVAGTMAEAEADGLHHPNAILGGDQAIATFAGAVGASKSTYRGPAVTIRTAKGHSLTVSPEHPIFTGSGWKTAESISVGENVFNPAGSNRLPSNAFGSANVDDVPTTVEDEFIAIKKVGSSVFIPAAGNNFNDDRKFIEGEVHVVVTDDCLLPVPDTHVIEESGKIHFTWANMGGASEVSDSPHPFGCHCVRDSIRGALPNLDPSCHKSPLNGGVGSVEHGGNIFAAQSGLVKDADPVNVDGLVPAFNGRESCPPESNAYARAGDSQNPADVSLAVPGGIELDKVVDVDRFTFFGHAYDFQTCDGIYALNGIISHNCRHTHSAYVPGFTNIQSPKPDPGHEGYKATQKQRYLERQIRASKRMEAAAIDPRDIDTAKSRIRAYQAKLRDHIKQHDLPRRRHREQLKQAKENNATANYGKITVNIDDYVNDN